MRQWWIPIFALLFSSLSVAQSTTAPTAHRAAVIVLTGEIDEFREATLKNAFAAARRAKVDTVILQLNTYGGLVTAGLDMSRFLKAQNDLHVIAFVNEKAISAGAMIALACDEIVMQPHALLGDCAPIVMGANGLESVDPTNRAKMESPILEDFRDSARRNGYDETLVTAMVSVGRPVHYVQEKDGARKFVDEAGYQASLKDGGSPVQDVRNPLNNDASLLTLSAELAKQLGVNKAIEASPESLAASRGLEIVATFKPSAGDALVEILASQAFRGVVLTIFMFALYQCFSHPGHGMAEVLATVTLGLLIVVPLLTGYAQWWEILSILAGLVLVSFEIFVIPGFGVAGIAGIALLLIGLTMTFVGAEPAGMPGILPQLPGTWAALRQATAIVVSGLFASLLLWGWLQRVLPRLPYFNRLILNRQMLALPGGRIQPVAVGTSAWLSVGATGFAITELRPGGSAAFHDDVLGDSRRIDVISESGFLVAGTRLIIREISGNRVIVRSS